MRKQILVAMTAILGLAVATVAMAVDPHVGTWKENVAKAKVSSGAPNKSQIVTFTAQENGLKLVAEGIDSEGKAIHAEWAAKFDSKDYPVTGAGADADTIAIKRIDANTFSELFKKAGKKAFSARLVVSKDGKIITRTTRQKNARGQEVSNTFIFEKQ